MSRRRSRKKKTSNQGVDWRALLTDPRVQQIPPLLISALGVITALALFEISQGRWANAWITFLFWWLGWGAYPATASILLCGLLWLAHQLDQPLKWRWRPFVGAELTVFSLMALTHAIMGRDDLWKIVGEKWSGGIVGWAVSTVLSTYLGWPAAVVILIALTLFGLAWTFDVTLDDLKRAAQRLRQIRSTYQSRRRSTADSPDEQSIAPRRQPSAPGAGRAAAAEARPQSTPAQLQAQLQAQPQAQVSPPTPPSPATVPPISPVVHATDSDEENNEPTSSVTSINPYFQRHFQLPPLTLLREPEGPALTDEEIRKKSNIIQKTLAQFDVPVEITEVRVGPSVTQFGVAPGYVERRNSSRKIRVNKISALSDDLALALAAPRIRVEAPVPGRPYVGIEVPNSNVQTVTLREVMEAEDFQAIQSPLTIALGRDVSGEALATNLSTMPHLLIAGTTGSGKSVCIKALTTCLVYNNSPAQLRLVMIDPKMVELVRFNGLPHLYGHVEIDLERVVKVLRWVAWEMDARYKRFARVAARNIDEYNHLAKEKGEATYPRLVVLIDELSDLMMLAPEEVEHTICRIAQMARATGIHLVVATQRPSTDVVTGLIKANFPARISFATVSQTDSRVILDMPGAETLMGQGDMLYLAADAGYPVRLQGCYVSEDETDQVVHFWREQVGFVEQQAPWERLIRRGQLNGDGDADADGDDELLEEAIELVQETGSASASLLQRKLRIGHPRAARLMRIMEDQGVIGPPVQAGRTRRVIIGEGEEGDG